MIALLLAAVLPRCADSFHLRWLAERDSLPAARVQAIAWTETRCNTSPRVRGKLGEIGRFQIRAATARAHCPTLNVRSYKGNTECFVKLFRENVARYGLTEATSRHNGRGDAACHYLKRVLTVEES